jgi:Type II CAAX prenyl endopeptidase Rce1-like
MRVEPEENNNQALLDVTFSRRQMYGVIAVAAFSGVAGIAAFTEIPERLQRKNLLDRVLSEIGENRQSAISTLVESTVMWAGNMILCNFMDKKGIQHGTHAYDGVGAEEFTENHPIRDYIHSTLTMPVIEEMVFRLVPASLFNEERLPNIKLHWDTGLVANSVFSIMHNFGSPQPGKFTFTIDSLPLEQFILGAYCWYAQRTGGFIHAAGAHILYNNLCTAYESRSDFGKFNNY